MERKERKICIMFGLMLITFINVFYISKITVEAANNKKIKSVTIKIDGINVTKQKYIVDVGDTIKLNVKVAPKQAKKSVSFVHYRSHILGNISKKGKVRAVGGGTAKITITVKAKNGKKKKTWVRIKVRDDEEDTYISDNSSSGNFNSSGNSSSFGDSNSSGSNITLNSPESSGNSSDHPVYDSNNENGSNAGNMEGSTISNVSNSDNNDVYTYDDFDDFAKAVSKLVRDHSINDEGGLASAGELHSGRLIVKGDGTEKLDFSKYNPETVLISNDDTYIVQFTTNNAAKNAMKDIANWVHVKWVEEDSCTSASEYESDNFVTESTDSSSLSWGVSRLSTDRFAEYIKERVQQKSILVGVIDTGVSYHTFMEGRIADNGYDFGDGDNDPSDTEGHGTHIAGTIVDCTPGLPVKILPIRVRDSKGRQWTTTISNGIKYAVQQGVKVINLSLYCEDGISQCMDDAIEYAVDRGVTVVVAAGNKNEDAAGYSPSHLDNVIVVGAVDFNEKKTNFSNFGWTVDVVAPGDEIKSTVPGNGYEVRRGTSMASPHIAAIAAMFLLDNEYLTPAQVEQLIKIYTRDLGDSGRDLYYGYGIPDLSQLVTIEPTNISLNAINSDGKIPINGTITLNATIIPDNAKDKSITWYSDNSGIAIVKDGTVTGVAKGNAAITAMTSNGLTASYQIEVYDSSDLDPDEVTNIILSKSNIRIQAGISYPLTATVLPENVSDKSVVWSSSNHGVAVVDSNGTVHGLAEGTAMITATAKNGVTATCSVSVFDPTIWDPTENPADNNWDPMNENSGTGFTTNPNNSTGTGWNS